MGEWGVGAGACFLNVPSADLTISQPNGHFYLVPASSSILLYSAIVAADKGATSPRDSGAKRSFHFYNMFRFLRDPFVKCTYYPWREMLCARFWPCRFRQARGNRCNKTSQGNAKLFVHFSLDWMHQWCLLTLVPSQYTARHQWRSVVFRCDMPCIIQ